MSTENQPKSNNNYIITLLAICVLSMLCLAYFLNDLQMPYASIKGFLQNILGNIIASTIAFLVIYLLLTNKGISIIDEWGEKIGKNIDTKLELDSNDLYQMYGLKGLRLDALYQDFVVSRDADDKNVNPVYYLWADVYFGNTINAEVINQHDGSPPFLRINFKSNDSTSWGCNIAIRPQDEEAVRWPPDMSLLTFKVRIPREVLDDPDLLKEVGISVRIANGKCQHWSHAKAVREDIQIPVDKNKIGEWITLQIDLNDKNNWVHFDSDGNQKVIDKDLSIISAVILKLGKYVPNSRGEFKAGKGVIDIGEIKFAAQKRTGNLR